MDIFCKNYLLECYVKILKENKWKFSPHVNNIIHDKIKANLQLEQIIKNILNIIFRNLNDKPMDTVTDF